MLDPPKMFKYKKGMGLQIRGVHHRIQNHYNSAMLTGRVSTNMLSRGRIMSTWPHKCSDYQKCAYSFGVREGW